MVAASEEKMRLLSEANDEELAKEAKATEEKKETSEKHDDVVNQLQVIIEERDGLREGMDLLWKDKICKDEDLENANEGYTHLSDRLVEKSEELMESQEELDKYEHILTMLQENAGKARSSSPAAQAAKQEDE